MTLESTQAAPHIPVLLTEVLAALSPHDGEMFVDGTFGAGGYSRAILGTAQCRVMGIDRDPSAVVRGQTLSTESGGRFQMVEGCFGDMEALLAGQSITTVDGIALDIGVSSMQVDEAERHDHEADYNSDSNVLHFTVPFRIAGTISRSRLRSP